MPRQYRNKMGLLVASLALMACIAACSATADNAESADWARAVSSSTLAGPSRRLLQGQPKAFALTCVPCIYVNPGKLNTQLGKTAFLCPQSEGMVAKALEQRNRATTLNVCCGKPLPSTLPLGTSDKDNKAFATMLTKNYACTDVSAYTVQLEAGTRKEESQPFKCGSPNVVYECV